MRSDSVTQAAYRSLKSEGHGPKWAARGVVRCAALVEAAVAGTFSKLPGRHEKAKAAAATSWHLFKEGEPAAKMKKRPEASHLPTAPRSVAPDQIYHAVTNGETETIRQLIQEGVDVASCTSHSGTPAFWIACRDGRTDIVRLLLEKGADIDAKPKDHGAHPICEAADWGHPEVVKLLIERDKEGSIAHIDARGGIPYRNEGVAEILIDAGAKVDFIHNVGETDLHRAAFFGSASVIKKLVDRGLDVNATDVYGHTPLHVAALDGRGEAVRALVKAGANIDAKGPMEKRPLRMALELARRTRSGADFSTAVALVDLGASLEGIVSEEVAAGKRPGEIVHAWLNPPKVDIPDDLF